MYIIKDQKIGACLIRWINNTEFDRHRIEQELVKTAGHEKLKKHKLRYLVNRFLTIF